MNLGRPPLQVFSQIYVLISTRSFCAENDFANVAETV